MKIKVKLLSVFFCMVATPSYAADGVAILIGSGQDANTMALSVQWDWEKRWFTEGDWWLGGYWELDGSYWKGKKQGANDIYGLGITPVLRLQRSTINTIMPYIELGIGAHLLSEKTVNDDKSLGTNFQFGDHLGAGILFGQDLNYDLGYRFQHYSNAGLSNENPGINFHELRIRYNF
ncbi:MAG TPA: acyloxyacyl hydrolase [Methylotenera sp.]|nr:acyloxyacyl hydrolase [Methylotenera sp.]